MCDNCGKYDPTIPDEIHIINAPRYLVVNALKENANFCKENNFDYPTTYKNLEKEIGN
jgi:hypothetical protein